jgi:hypothetical protein
VSALARTGPGQTGGSGQVSISRARCVRTTVRAPLTANGLTGGETESGDHRVCEVPATILVRIRAVFAQPVEVATGPTLAKGRIEAALLAVATKTKAPLVFATLDDASGQAAVFTSPSRCIGG